MESQERGNVSTGRIHGLDALRGILMMLGVVLHAGLSELWSQSGDETASSVIEGTMHFIHIFRMPAFFLLSGFFGALLWYRRGPGKTIRNRFDRLVLPFLGFLFILWPLLNWGSTYLKSLYLGHHEPLWRSFGDAMNESLPPGHLIHLWFLYYLVIITILSTSVVLWLERLDISWPRVQCWVVRTFESPWRSLFILGGLVSLWFLLTNWGPIPTADRWAPDPLILLFYLLFYAFGWSVYRAEVRLETLTSHAWTLVGLGLVFGLLYFASWEALEEAGRAQKVGSEVIWYVCRATASGGAIVALTRGFIGVFIRHANSGAYAWRYISDASYWVYLFHISICISVPYLLASWNAPVLVKYGVTMLITCIGCLVTYDLFIRSTWVGSFLNGRRSAPWSFRLNLCLLLLLVGALGLGWSHLSRRHQVLHAWKQAGGTLSLVPFNPVLKPWVRLSPTASVSEEVVKRCIPIGDYAYCPVSVTRKMARTACEDLGGSLLMLETAAENTAVNRDIASVFKKPFWLDLDDLKREGAWTWKNGVSLNYSGWDKTQPDSHGGNEDCAAANWGGRQRWHDVPCIARFPFVCEALSTGETRVDASGQE